MKRRLRPIKNRVLPALFLTAPFAALRALPVVLLFAMLFAFPSALPSFAADTWQQVGEEWYCYDSYGNLHRGDWCRNGIFYYYTDPTTGAIVKNSLVDVDGYRYYCDSDGIRVTDKLQRVDIEGRPDGYEWMYFQPVSGRAATGEITISSKQYVFDDNGYMLYGLLSEALVPVENYSEAEWYLGERDQGTGYTGWLHMENMEDINYPGEDSLWFYFNKGKKYKNTYVTKNGSRYQLDENGAMLHGWVRDVSAEGEEDWKYYGTSEEGVLKRSCWIQSDFNFETEEAGDELRWYYLDAYGVRKGLSDTEFVSRVDNRFYLFYDGYMHTGLAIGTVQGNDFTDQANFIPDEKLTETYGKTLSTLQELPLYDDAGNRLAVMYFSTSQEEEGVMKTGTQQAELDGEMVTMTFDKHGYALEGVNKDRIYQNGLLQTPEESHVAIKQLRLGNETYPAGWYLVSENGAMLFSSQRSDGEGFYWVATARPSEEDGAYCVYRIPEGGAAAAAAGLLKTSHDTEEEWLSSGQGEYYCKQAVSGGKYYDIYRLYDEEKHCYDVELAEAAQR